MRRRLEGVLLLALCFAPHRLGGQTTEAAPLRGFRDSLDAVTTIPAATELVARERRGTVADKSLRRLRYGWALIRLGELSNGPDPLIRAAQEFYEAAGRARRPSEAWFGVGSAKSVLDALGAREFRSQHQTAGVGWRQGAITAYMEAIRLDPDDREAAIEAAKLSLRDDNIALRTGLSDAIERAVRADSNDPLGWMLLGRLYRRQGLDSTAAYAYGHAVRLGGSVEGIASLELGRELIWIDLPDSGQRMYYRGASSTDPAAQEGYRRDLAIIAPDSVLAEWDRLAPALRPGWLHGFWRSREVASGRPEGTRLPEHERRWRLAYRRYRLPPAWTHQYQWGMPYRSGNDDIDDRGIIYIRHGDPDRVITHPAGIGEESAVTWIYERPEGRLIFHFKLSVQTDTQPSVSGWRMVESVTEIANANVLPDLIDVDPIYMSMYQASQRLDRAYRESPLRARERLMVLASVRRGTTTDSDPLRFERRMHPIVQAYGIGGDLPGNGRILLLWAIPGAELPHPDTLPGMSGLFYTLRTRINITDTTGRLILATDTLRRFHAAAAIPATRFLAGTTTFDLASGAYRFQLTLADSAESAGALRVVPDIPVPAFSGPMEMSDLVLGLEGEEVLWWDAAGSRFPLNPRNAWRASEALEVGFEFAGLPAGTPFEVRTAITDLGADSTRPPEAAVRFSRIAAGRRELVVQHVALRGLKPGLYLLTTWVTAGDRMLRRERRITIVAGDR